MPFLDVSAARAVETIICDAREAGRTVYIIGMNGSVQKVLSVLDADHCLPENTTYDRRIDAIKAAVNAWLNKDKSSGNALPSAAG